MTNPWAARSGLAVLLLAGACGDGVPAETQVPPPAVCTPFSVVASGTLGGVAFDKGYSWGSTSFESLQTGGDQFTLQFGGDGVVLMDAPTPTPISDFGGRLAIGPVQAGLLRFPTGDPQANDVYCFQQGGYEIPGTKATGGTATGTVSLRGVALLGACPGGGAAVAGALAINGSGGLTGMIDGLALGPANGGWTRLTTYTPGENDAVILSLKAGSTYAFLRPHGPATTSVRPATGVIVTTTGSPGQGAVYCASSGSVEITDQQGVVSVSLSDFSRLGSCAAAVATDSLGFGCL
jgi:hypothetical protein